MRQFLSVSVCIVALSLCGCSWWGVDPSTLPPPVLTHYDAWVEVEVESIQTLKYDKRIRGYTATVKIIRAIKNNSFMVPGKTMDIEVEIECVKYDKLTAGEKVQLKLIRIPGKEPKFRLTPGGVVRDSK